MLCIIVDGLNAQDLFIIPNNINKNKNCGCENETSKIIIKILFTNLKLTSTIKYS